ncbi:hypothetical protein PHJA_002007000 [Phtheirospermum japonicum]|uniref:Uncharacterized protein n=1 Tax=Phtheirospermum japonicum TaxID=374723 RepID=A0A830CWM0_9LAMI|nr:hypothetical protein PHJA_002007000 [Phtheirospermum japonicum]
MPTMKETFPHEDQQIDERMARIMEHPSLKSLLGEEEDGAMMRGAIIILLAYWIDSDHEDKTLKDVLSIDNQDGSENLCIENIACGVEIGSGLANILEDLLKLVRNPPLALDEDCKAHFKIVNIAWKHNQLISLLLKKRHVIHKIQRYSNVSSQQLRESLTPLVKAHPLIKDILQESEASSVRHCQNSYSRDDMKVEPTSTSEGRGFVEPSSYTQDALMPDPALINQLLHDAPFMDVAQQIQCEPRAVQFADFVLDCLTYNSINLLM